MKLTVLLFALSIPFIGVSAWCQCPGQADTGTRTLTIFIDPKLNTKQDQVCGFLADANALFADPRGANIPVRLGLNGALHSFERREVITNCNDTEALFKDLQHHNPPVDVYVIDQIGCCPPIMGAVTEPGPLLGCAQPNGPMVVVANAASLAGVLWVHEYGHTHFLLHAHAASHKDVMLGFIRSGHIKMSPCERDHFMMLIKTPCADDVQGQPSDIANFVRQTFIEGIPRSEARAYKAADVKKLTTMLTNCDENSSWMNIVLVIGMIGDHEAFVPLKTFLENDPVPECGQEVPLSTYQAKEAVPIALGRILSKSYSDDVFKYLQDGQQSKNWSSRVSWKRLNENENTRNTRLALKDTVGLNFYQASVAKKSGRKP